MERFVASKGRLPSWAAKIRVKSPKRLTLVRYGVTPNWYMIRPELDPNNEEREEISLSSRQGFFEG
jgi:hypothetical protein